MALNPELISFFLRNIQRANQESFGSEVSHLFEHLQNEIKDNPIYSKYIEDSNKWEDFFKNPDEWKLPESFENAKSFVFSLYKRVAHKGEDGFELAMNMFSERKINDCIYSFNNQFIEYFSQTLQEIINANPEIEEKNIEKVKGNTVFIIHGHDNELKTEVQLLLTRAGVNNIVLHEQPDKGRSVIDKLEEESSTSNYAIALLSPDDTLIDGSARARQNVILEVGYFIGKLGKERVRLLKKSEIEIPSDLQGILYEKYDTSGAWKIKICKELMAVGIYVDMNEVANKL